MSMLVCRTCLYVNRDIQVFKSIEKVKDVLKFIVPEMCFFTSCVVCTQCYYFLKNVENFKIKCLEVQKQLVTFNFEQLQSPPYSHINETVHNKRPATDTQQQKPEKKIRRTYVRKKKEKVSKDQQLPIGINYENSLFHNPSMYEVNHHLQHQLPYPNQPQGNVLPQPAVSGCNNYATPNINNYNYNNFVSPTHNNVATRPFNTFNTAQGIVRDTVIQSRPPNYNGGQVLIDKLFDVVNKHHVTNSEEKIIDLAEFIASKEGGSVPISESNINEENQVEEVVDLEKETSLSLTESQTTVDGEKTNDNVVHIEAQDICVEVEVISDSEDEKNDSSEENCEDDIFDEGNVAIVKNEHVEEETPSFFNRQSENGFYDCKLCSKKYKTSKGLYEHTQMKHQELKFYHCEMCHFFTLWKSALVRHTELFHTKDQVDILEFLFCFHCSFRTSSKAVLEKHLMNIHFSDGAPLVV